MASSKICFIFLKYWSIIVISVSDHSAVDCHCLGWSDFPLFLVQLQCKYFAFTMHGLANVYWKVNNYSFIVVWQKTKIAAPTTSFFEKIMEICFIIASYISLICLIMASYMRHGWIWWRVLDTGLVILVNCLMSKYKDNV